jgi:hypothetical protein
VASEDGDHRAAATGVTGLTAEQLDLRG